MSSNGKPPPPPGHGLFKAFLERHGIGPRQAARELAVTHVAVMAWRDERSIPQEPARVAIEKWTKGEVPRSSWETEHEREQLARYAAVEPFAEKAPTGTDGAVG